jgi:hypothetical protein
VRAALHDRPEFVAELADYDQERSEARNFRAVTLAELFTMKLPQAKSLMHPILSERLLGMIFGVRGMGKTFYSLGVAWAVSTGGKFLTYSADVASDVLVVDGEMPTAVLKNRFAQLALGDPREIRPEDARLRVLAADMFPDPLPSLATREGQRIVEDNLKSTKLLILDNVSTLFGSQVENDAEAWSPAQEWLLALRRSGVAVLLVHHAGKGGEQRGTSRREDILDLVVRLRVPGDHKATEGCRFEVSYTKSRGLIGAAVDPFEAALRIDDKGAAVWTTCDLGDKRNEQVRELLALGLKASDISVELGVSRATAFRYIKAARGE